MSRQRGIDTDDLRVRLAIGRARITVKCAATNARGMRRRPRIVFVEQHADRQTERMQSLLL